MAAFELWAGRCAFLRAACYTGMMNDSLTRAILERALLLGGLLLSCPLPAVAQEQLQDRLRDCAAIEGSFKRLDCFDALAREIAGPSDEKEGVAVGKWLVEERSSGIGDDTDIYMVVRAVEKVPGEDDPVRPILVVRCEAGDTAVIFNFRRFIDQSRAEATMRIDDGELLTATLKMSASGKAFGFWQGEEAVPFARRLIGAKRLFVQVTPFGAQPVVAEFPVLEFEAAAAALRQACGW